MNFIKKNKEIIIIFLIAFIVLSPFLFSEYMLGHDSHFHLLNEIALTKNIGVNFLFPSHVLPDLARGFGYGSEFFYAPLAHNAVAYINYFTGSITLSVKIFYYLILALSGVTMYFLARRYYSNRIALVSATIYMLFPYHLSDILVRDAQAEACIFIFLPLILSGIYELFKGDKRKFYMLFVFGYVGGMLSHLVMMVFMTLFLLIYLAFNYKKLFENIKHFIIASGLILLIVSPFLQNIIIGSLNSNYLVFGDKVMAEFVWCWGLIPYDFINYIPYHSNNIMFFIDIIALILLVVSLFNYKKLKGNKWYLIFLLGTMILTTKLFLWDIMPSTLKMIQFPWRIMTFVALAMSIVAPLCLKKYKKVNVYLLIIPMIIFATFSNVGTQNHISGLDYSLGLGWQKEYLPIAMYENIEYYENRDSELLLSKGEGFIIENETPYLKFEITESAKVELPRLYYDGYKLIDKEGNKQKIYQNEKGFIEVDLEAGTYELKHSRTLIENICIILSICSIIGLLVWRMLWKKSV